MNLPANPTRDREQISSLVDGELAGSDFDAALRAMASAEARECWHAYQLIGDVLRAPDLAAWDRGPRLVEALGDELRHGRPEIAPRQPAPGSLPQPDMARPAANDAVFRWKMVAGLASFAAITAAGWMLLGGIGPSQSPAGPQLAVQQRVPAPDSPQSVVRVAAQPGSGQELAPAAAGVMLRDPELDRLLAAHQQSAGVSAFGNPAGFLRSATFEGPGR